MVLMPMGGPTDDVACVLASAARSFVLAGSGQAPNELVPSRVQIPVQHSRRREKYILSKAISKATVHTQIHIVGRPDEREFGSSRRGSPAHRSSSLIASTHASDS